MLAEVAWDIAPGAGAEHTVSSALASHCTAA